MKHCIDCEYLNLDGTCNDKDHIIAKEGNRIKHPEIAWCVNIEIKKEKERK